MAALAAAQPRSFTPVDLAEWREIPEVRISADASKVVYVESSGDRANLWTVSTDGKALRQLTGGAWTDSSPRWSEDASRLAWISTRGRTPQIYVRRTDGGEDRQITRGDAAMVAFSLSPDGNTIAYVARVSEPLPGIGWAPPSLLPQLRTTRSRLFVIAADGSGASRQIALGSLEPVGEPAWMPDGRSLLIALSPPFDPEHPLEGPEIYSLRVGDSSLRKLTNHPGPDYNPVPSPDGTRIAWLSREAAAQSYTVAKLRVANADGSRARNLAGALDRDPVNPQWSSDSRTVYFLADDRGATHVYAARNDGAARQVTKARDRLHGFYLADNGRAVAVRSPGEVIAFPVDVAGTPVVLAAPNSGFLRERAIGGVEEFSYLSGTRTIQAWLTKPPGFDPAHRYPLLLDFDDSPRRMCGGEFRLRSQILAAAGFIVLCANPRGTPGYGEAFGNLIRSGIPGDAFDDLMAGVEAVSAKSFVDHARIGIVGGLMAAWAVGHTDRFHAAVARRPVADFTVDVATSPDGVHRAAAWMGAWPWVDPEQYVKHSPLYFAGNFKTPTLVIAGEHDAGAEELFFALRLEKVDSAMVRPTNAETDLEATIAWLRR
jgi:acylaminoacyl-peptidase